MFSQRSFHLGPTQKSTLSVKVFVFGNPLIEKDSLPLRILPRLRKRFPQIEFVTADPTELLHYDQDAWILDTAEGITEAVVLEDISKLDLPKRLSVHDYDLTVDLHLLQKLGKLQNVKIIAVPFHFSRNKAFQEVSKKLIASGFSKSG